MRRWKYISTRYITGTGDWVVGHQVRLLFVGQADDLFVCEVDTRIGNAM